MNLKSFLTSKTIWGLIITALAAAAQHLHLTFLPADVENLTTGAVELAGILFSAYGRVVATGPLTTPPAQ